MKPQTRTDLAATLPASEVVRVARLLAIDKPETLNDVQLARRVSEGLLPRSVAALAAVLGTNRVVGPVVPEATLRRARKANKPLSREISERLYELGRVVDAVGHAYHGDRDAVESFLNRPHPLLEGETPFDMARSQFGRGRSSPESHPAGRGRHCSLMRTRTRSFLLDSL